MPVVRRITPVEASRFLERNGRVDIAPYADGLAQLTVGDWGLIELQPGETAAVVKRRYSMAARDQGKRLVYKRTRLFPIVFEVCAAHSVEPR